MISKELLSEVLKIEIDECFIAKDKVVFNVPNYESEEDGEIVYINMCSNINIYELLHKCEDWITRQGYIANFRININPKSYAHIMNIERLESKDYVKSFDCEKMEIDLSLKIEYVFKASQWILENK